MHALEAVMAAHLGVTFPAAAIAVVQRGELVLERAWGWIDPDMEQIPATTGTLFDLGALTRLFTATAFLSLVSEGRVGLDDPIVTVIPEFGAPHPITEDHPYLRDVRPTARANAHDYLVDPARVTFRDLLAPAGGKLTWRAVYKAVGDTPPLPGQPDAIAPRERWARGLAYLCSTPFWTTPSSGNARDSDLGFMLLGEAAARLHLAALGRETVGGAWAADYLESTISRRVREPLSIPTGDLCFRPLERGLEPERIAPTGLDEHWRARRLWGEPNDANAAGVGGAAGHGGLFTTARTVAALGEAWRTRSDRLGIDPPLMEEAVTPEAGRYDDRGGLLWIFRRRAIVFGTGSGFVYGLDSDFGTSLWIDPARERVVVVLTDFRL